jgi:hypothetical protein
MALDLGFGTLRGSEADRELLNAHSLALRVARVKLAPSLSLTNPFSVRPGQCTVSSNLADWLSVAGGASVPRVHTQAYRLQLSCSYEFCRGSSCRRIMLTANKFHVV